MRSFILSLVFVTATIGNGSVQADSPKPIDAARWKAMRLVSQAVVAERSRTKAQGKDPKKVWMVFKTSLSYSDLAIAAYYQPKTVKDAEAIANSDEMPELSVLAKQLFEANVKRGTQLATIKDCLFATCVRREVSCPIITEGMGIYEAPITAKFEYSARIIDSN